MDESISATYYTYPGYEAWLRQALVSYCEAEELAPRVLFTHDEYRPFTPMAGSDVRFDASRIKKFLRENYVECYPQKHRDGCDENLALNIMNSLMCDGLNLIERHLQML